MKSCKRIMGLLLFVAGATLALAQSPINTCNVPSGQTPPVWCNAVRGDRGTGSWVAQARSEVMAQHGIVTASQPLAAQAGLRILMAGGNAIDAAVATASTLNLTEPVDVGIGGDMFAIIYIAKENKLYQLNAGGMAPTGATVAYYNSLGYFYDPTNWGYGSGMPVYGILAAPVPSAAWGWDEVVRRFGKLSLLEDLTPAIEYAEHGFPIPEMSGIWWQLPNAVNCSAAAGCTQLDPDSVAAWYINGQPPVPGQIFKNPDLAHTFRLFGQQGRKVFYQGEIAQAIVKKSQALGGTMTLADLANYYGEWVTPPTTNYHGYDVYETMAPSQAWATLEMLNILEVCVPQWIPGKTLADLGPTNPQYWHLIVESKKLAYVDLYDYNSDPDTWSSSQWALFQTLISKPYAATLCSKVKPNGPAFTPTPTYNDPSSTAPAPGVNTSFSGKGDTVVFSTADRWGNMVSWVNSNFQSFGTGVTIPGYGFVLNDRMAQFTLNPNHPNHIAPHKRPYDTISAAFVVHNGTPLMTLGLMGGDMQVQGHGQMLVNILDLGANMQATSDMARFYHNEIHNVLELESQLYNLVGSSLINTYGHNAISVDGDDVGGYDAIMFTLDPNAPRPNPDDASNRNGPLVNVPPVNGFYRAGAELREDGEPVGW